MLDYKKEIEQCVKCGACQTHCPVFKTHRKEAAVARGKLALVKALLNEDLELSEHLMRVMSQCLLCGSCCDKCPNQVPTEEIVMAARREIARMTGLSTFDKVASTALRHNHLMKLVVRSGHKLSKLLFEKVPENSGLHLRFETPFISRDRTLPEIAAKPFLDRYPEYIQGDNNKPGVTFFTGCMVNFIYPQIGEALLRILAYMGFSVYLPHQQGCCGLPALSSGDTHTAEVLFRRNLKSMRLNENSAIVTACASCNACMGKYFREMGGEYEKTGRRVIDIFDFLETQGLVEQLKKVPKSDEMETVTYHDPCHLRNQKITFQPRSLLRALPSVQFTEMGNADHCCGLGGTFSVHHYDTSVDIGSKKASHIEASGASLVATACPGCILQLQDSMNRAGLKARSIHALELIARDLTT
jgi:glycolate oxidase iron-sulfur subunit